MALYSPTDHGYAWLILAGSAFMSGMGAFHICGLGVFMVEYMHYFNLTKSQVAWVSTCYMVLGPISGIQL